ncbi:hypothetical protein MalM25_16430 [Planctomycetes bacterium MalM25]|nr:hypothetical protein MalM25_16430 [Planctomycetes bacterium MalM25]
MTQREKTLIIAIVTLGGLWFLWRGFDSYQQAYNDRVRDTERLQDELFDQQLEVRRGKQALRQLERYQSQSLPIDPDVARSDYSDWLKEAIQSSGLELGSVKWNATRPEGDAATALTFSANAAGSPEGVVRLLDAYHRLDSLHQLTNLQLRPTDEEGSRWAITLTSVALILEGAEREEGLPEEPIEPPRLRLATADEYVDSVVGRNLFTSYTPPPPPRPEKPKVVRRDPPPKPSPPPFDDAKHAQLTGIVETGAQLQAWIRIRTTGETLRLHAGDELEVGLLKGRVQAVLPREIVVESEEGVVWRAALGDKLRDARSKSAKPAA